MLFVFIFGIYANKILSRALDIYRLLLVLRLKARKMAKIRNRYNQAPHLTQDTTCESNKNTIKITNKSKEVSPFPAGTLICLKVFFRIYTGSCFSRISSLLIDRWNLTIFILDIGEHVIWQTVTTQMKCCIRQHFIRVYNVCKDKAVLSRAISTSSFRNLDF